MNRRLPKRGFVNIFRKEIAIINVGELERFDAGITVDERLLREARLVQGACDGIKVLGNGQLSKALTVSVDCFSKSAIEKIEKAGGKAIALIAPPPSDPEEASA
jgi:large subunit ribosomal protein L15